MRAHNHVPSMQAVGWRPSERGLSWGVRQPVKGAGTTVRPRERHGHRTLTVRSEGGAWTSHPRFEVPALIRGGSARSEAAGKLDSMKAHSAIGARLRAAREERGLTLKALADSMGVTSSLLSQIEMDKVQPSLNTLYQLATNLDLSVDALLGLSTDNAVRPHRTVVVQHESDNPSLVMSGGVRWERLACRAGLDLEPLQVTYPPRAASSADQGMLASTGLEFGVLVSGSLTLRIGFETHQLEAGDSVFFDRARPHVYINEGETEARGFWFVVGSRTAVPVDTARGADESQQLGSLLDVLRVLDAHEDW